MLRRKGSCADNHPWVGQHPSHGAPSSTSSDQLYPTGDIFAVVDDRATANRALRALRDAGVPDDELDLWDGEWFEMAVRNIEQRHGLWERLSPRLATKKGETVLHYVGKADKGHLIIVVYTAAPQVAERVRRVLAAQGAHHISHFRRLTAAQL